MLRSTPNIFAKCSAISCRFPGPIRRPLTVFAHGGANGRCPLRARQFLPATGNRAAGVRFWREDMIDKRTAAAAILGELIPELEYAAPVLLDRLDRGLPLVERKSPSDL